MLKAHTSDANAAGGEVVGLPLLDGLRHVFEGRRETLRYHRGLRVSTVSKPGPDQLS